MVIPNPMVKFTYEDCLNTPEDKRCELLDGELVTIPTPGELHQSVSAQLGWRLVQFASENNLGRVYHAPYDVVLSNTDVVQPDLLFVSNERGHIITPREHSGCARLGRRNPVPIHGHARQDIQAHTVCQARREGGLDGGHYRKNHNGPAAR